MQERETLAQQLLYSEQGKRNVSERLAASQAREQQLRRLLDKCYPHPLVSIEYNEILALPQDDTALRQWGAKLLREMATRMGIASDYRILADKADELEAGKC